MNVNKQEIAATIDPTKLTWFSYTAERGTRLNKGATTAILRKNDRFGMADDKKDTKIIVESVGVKTVFVISHDNADKLESKARKLPVKTVAVLLNKLVIKPPQATKLTSEPVVSPSSLQPVRSRVATQETVPVEVPKPSIPKSGKHTFADLGRVLKEHKERFEKAVWNEGTFWEFIALVRLDKLITPTNTFTVISDINTVLKANLSPIVLADFRLAFKTNERRLYLELFGAGTRAAVNFHPDLKKATLGRAEGDLTAALSYVIAKGEAAYNKVRNQPTTIVPLLQKKNLPDVYLALI